MILVACRTINAVNVNWIQKSLLPATNLLNRSLSNKLFTSNFHSLTINNPPLALTTNPAIINLSNNLLQHQPTRNVTKFSLGKGKRRTVRAVLKRFKRLDWGGWIRTRSGRHKKMWSKSPALRKRLKQHVLVNATQSTLLDKMVTNFWKRPKYYINDPYAPYHKRENFHSARKTPRQW